MFITDAAFTIERSLSFLTEFFDSIRKTYETSVRVRLFSAAWAHVTLSSTGQKFDWVYDKATGFCLYVVSPISHRDKKTPRREKKQICEASRKN